MKVAIRTLGCRTNQAEGEILKEELKKRGFEPADEGEADVFILNTCTVTSEADRKCRKLMHRAKKRGQILVVTGCYAQREKRKLFEEGADIVVPQLEKENLPSLLCEKLKREEKPEVYEGGAYPEKAKAFLKVQDGCNHFCSYCIVPFVRGRERSSPVEAVLERARELIKAGFKEVVLTGIRLGRYGVDINTSLTELLRKLLEISDEVRFRLSSIDLKDISFDLIEMMKSEERICPHLHIPLQSGSEIILKAMRRPYKPENFLQLVEACRENIPHFVLTTDVMVGFPGENEEDFKKTVEVLEQAKPAKIHTFIFSPRPGTEAASLEGRIPPEARKERSRLIQEIESKLFLEEVKRFLGEVLTVLVEEKEGEYYKGTTENYLKVCFKGEGIRIGELRRVKLTRVSGKEILGELERRDEKCQSQNASFVR
jgi:threonylcarbamoyladenosine tRNA methylthiotransferase MtaB